MKQGMNHPHKLKELTGNSTYRYECTGCGARFVRKPPNSSMQLKPASDLTDRAKRYRAQRNPPPGRKICNFCASRKNIDIDHVTGNESDGAPDNLIYLCRTCNTQKGVIQARNRIGIRTRQYNPWKMPTFAQFKRGAKILLGFAPGDVAEATELVKSTPPEKRAAFAEKIEAEQKRNPAPTFAQYAHGVSIHTRGAHDEGGVIIHATPPALRSKYARQIAAKKRKHSKEVPF